MEFSYRTEPTAEDPESVRGMVDRTGFFRPDETEIAVELVEERLAKGERSGYHFWFTESDTSLRGYVCFGPTPCTVGSFDLYWIVVDSAWQGAGIGRELMRRAEESVREMGGRKIYVETSGKALYLPTQEFYTRVGYREAARLVDFYDVGDDKLIFEKSVG